MKIEELSIGDWVVAKLAKWESDDADTTPPLRVKRIDGIERHNLYVDLFNPATNTIEHTAFVEDLIPIPLTPEILEKNGFVKAELATVIEWYHWRDVFIGFKDGLIYTSINGREIWGMRHVHQLQHALRLAGIEKEIEV